MVYTYDDYTIAWISALTIELSAAQTFLDERHDDLPALPGDHNVYSLGSMGNHKVVLVCLPEGVIGTNAAAYATANLFRTFPNVSYTLLVGIGGGIPAAGVRLGDVVVGVPIRETGGVVQYDRGTNIQDSDFVRKGFLRGPPLIILNAVSKMRATKQGNDTLEYIERINQQGFHRPLEDNLFEADYLHTGNDCSECDKNRLIQRPERGENVTHYGLIGSGNQVVRNAQFRDQLYEKDKIICVETEAAGLLESVECIVIRGICDYCDTHKNKDWQPYASAVAAAYAYELLSYIPVVKVLVKEETVEDKDKRAKFLTALYTCPYEERKNINVERIEGTCNWFTQHPILQNWLEQKSGVLWTSADPGCGKSVLARYLIDVFLPTSSRSRTICYFFFRDDFTEQRSVKDALCGIIRQLFKQQPSLLRKNLIEQYAEDGDKMFNLQELWKILVNACSNPAAGEVVCVFDALDECQQDEAKQLIRAICELHSKPIQGSLKILVTSRPYFYIEDAFRDLEAKVPMIRLAGEQDAEMEQIEEEIGSVVDHRLESLARSRSLTSKEVDQIKTRLTSVPNRTYLWVTLIFNHIEELLGVTNMRIKKLLEELPQTANEVYDKILHRSTDRNSTRMLLQAILAAFEPLTLEYASIILSMDQNQASLKELADEVEPDERCRIRIRNICGLFVVVSDSKIYLLHQTAREFLLGHPLLNSNRDVSTLGLDKTMITGPVSWYASFNAENCHEFLAEQCIRYLLMKHQGCTDKRQSFHSWIYIDQLGNFRGYCYNHWVGHLREARTEIGSSITQLATILLQTLFPSDKQQQCNCQLGFRFSIERYLGWINVGPDTVTIPAYLGLASVVKFVMQTKNYERRELSRALCLAAHSNDMGLVEFLLSKDVDINVDSNGRRVDIEWSLEYDSKLLSDANRMSEHIQNISDAPFQGSQEQGTTNRGIARALAVTSLTARSPEDAANPNNSANNLVSSILDSSSRYTPFTDVPILPLGAHNALVEATFHGNIRMMELLLHHGAYPNARMLFGSTPLHTAVSYRNAVDLEVIKLLVKNGAKPSLEDHQGFTPLARFLMYYGDEGDSYSKTKTIFRMLRTPNFDIDKRYESSEMNGLYFEETIVDNDKMDFSTHGPDPSHYSSLLLEAAGHGCEERVKVLLEEGADPRIRDSTDRGLLHWAVFGHNRSVLEHALSLKLSPNDESTKGQTPLMAAALELSLDTAKILITAGADVNYINKYGMTALMVAGACTISSSHHHDFVEYLLSVGSDVDTTDHRGRTALMHAIKKRDTSIIYSLIQGGASVIMQDLDGDTCLHYAVGLRSSVDCIQAILATGLDVNVFNYYGHTPLCYTVESHPKFDNKWKGIQVMMVEYLIEHGARICENCLLDLILASAGLASHQVPHMVCTPRMTPIEGNPSSEYDK